MSNATVPMDDKSLDEIINTFLGKYDSLMDTLQSFDPSRVDLTERLRAGDRTLLQTDKAAVFAFIQTVCL